jgi:hypothetical protein
MSVKEFWEDNPDLFWAYRFSYYNNMKNEQEALNFQLWLQGLYFHEAVSVALFNSFGKGKKLTYSDKPYILSQKEEEEEYKKQQKKLEIQIKNRISEMQKIKGKEEEALPNQKGEGGENNNG